MPSRQWFKIGEDEYKLILECTDGHVEALIRASALCGKCVMKVEVPPKHWIEKEHVIALSSFLKAQEYLQILQKELGG